jgi:hypothetical protein
LGPAMAANHCLGQAEEYDAPDQKGGPNRKPQLNCTCQNRLEGKHFRMGIPGRFVSLCSVSRILIHVAVATIMFAVTQPMWSQGAKHPIGWINGAGPLTKHEKTRYPMVQLKMPPKEEALA